MGTFRLSAKAVFDEAVEIASPAERRAYLDRVCADAPALQREVEALLAAYADAGSFLETPPVAPGDSTDPRPAAERPGTMIGPYRLVQQIGEGGMGVVWLAEQTQPVHRQVALKVIKPGMDSRQVVARFEAERQALAVMDHVNIARVFDGGSTAGGLPYFVMELVHGVPITKYCDDNQLTPRERLELFVPVCQAIQHAHQKGVIHRDIKPSNVLVTLYDGRPVPKVIDFGVAKATEQKPSDRTLFTQCGMLVGTLEYMSPEQAEMSAQGVDTRCDIFSLGVLLYELLTGSTPLTRERMQAAAQAELLRLIKEEEPQKPSTRLSESGDALASISAKRDTEPARLTKLMRGDLDWILLKCLEKDRTRRYETANGLAVDILRHLNDEPVSAGAPTAGYRLRKFVKRYRARVIAAGIVAAALVLGVVGTTSGMVWALDERDRANAEANRATLAAESETKARKRAETICEFVTTALGASDAQNTGAGDGPVEAGYDMTILAAMDNAIKDIDAGRFVDDPETEARLRATIGVIFSGNGKYDRARLLMEQVLAMVERLYKGDDPTTAQCAFNLAEVYCAQGQYTQAEPLYARALDICEKIFGPNHPEVAKRVNGLASLYRRQGLFAQAEPLLTRALAIREQAYGPDHPEVAYSLNSLAVFYKDQGQWAQAEPFNTRALAIREKAYGPDHPDVANSLSNLANVYFYPGEYAQAERLYTRALAIREKAYGPDHPGVADCLTNLARVYRARGQHDEAEPLLLRALAIWTKAFRPDHPDVLMAKGNLASLYWSQGRLDKSVPLLEEVLEAKEAKLGRQHLSTLNTVGNLGVNYADAGRVTEAIPLLEEAYRASKQYPQLGFAGPALAEVYRTRGQFDQAELLYTEALANTVKTVGPDHPEALKAKGSLAAVYWSQGRLDKSVPLFEEVLEGLEAKLGRQDLETLRTMGNLGVNYADAGRPMEAIPLLEEAYRASKQYPQLRFTGPALANVYRAQGQFDQAELLYTEVLASTEKTRGPDHPAALRAKGNLATLYWSRGRLDKSIPLFEEALEGLEAKLGRRDVETLTMVGNLGVNYLNAGRLTEAITLLEEAYQASKQYAQLGFAGPELLVAYIKAADPARPESIARVVVLIQEKLAALRGALPKDSPQLAAQLALSGQALLTVKAWDEAWPLVREALTIREAKAPDDWTTSNTRSLLGEVLLGQHKLTEAEPLLLDGYRGIMQREAAIPASAKVRIPEALQRLVRLYEAKSDETEAAAWRSRLEAALAEQAKPEAKGSGR